ncbi:Hsp20/alpha crystallin family protein [Streptomyces zaomyceticus]|uniref:Hsp20/alpha crystallin family protein n=1 Tax=Streptomyces zaomyceticus TaxID=68286 RepID=UPI00167ABB7B|nr:Hsp20/alpha crystallin family protein [Streptomyces zaomyceticus]GHG26868.1 hypothetical protein GCM10018791_48490 [Streptomyces zaomyceticus]
MTGGNRERGHSLFPDFNVLFDREFPGLPGWRPATAAHSIPVEMSTDGGVCVLRAELPGVDPEDITIRADGDVVTVSAERGESTEDGAHSEFRHGSFRRMRKLGAREHITFGGAVTAETPGPIAGALVRQGKGGDFRSPERIRARAHHIGTELAATP